MHAAADRKSGLTHAGARSQNYVIRDLQGRPVKAGLLSAGEKKIDLSDLTSGHYLIDVTGAQHKIIKQ